MPEIKMLCLEKKENNCVISSLRQSAHLWTHAGSVSALDSLSREEASATEELVFGDVIYQSRAC